MPCYICNQAMDEPKLDPRDNKLAPCSTCEGVIQDCIDSYPKIGKDDEDILSSEDMVAYIEPSIDDYKDLTRYGTFRTDY